MSHKLLYIFFRLNLNDAIDNLVEEDVHEPGRFYVLPREGDISDEDSGDEQGGTVQNFSSRQLKVIAEVDEVE